MFNLLMRYTPWGDGRDTAPLDRLFEYTTDDISILFKDGNHRPLLDKLIRYPCLFMQEGMDNQIAWVGTITRARVTGNVVAIEYALDLNIPPLENNWIYSNKTDFDIHHDFEFSRTHWAVKDADLYRVLIRKVQSRRPRPKVFELPEHEKIDTELISVMMPFDAAFTDVFQAIKDATDRVKLQCYRADDIWQHASVIQDVVSLIDKSRIVICDCTHRNPNVFYEIGIAHTLGREVILVAQSNDDVPFDLRHLRYIQYLNNSQGRRELSDALENRLKTILGTP